MGSVLDYIGNNAIERWQNYMDRDQNFLILKRKLEELNGLMEDNQSMKSVGLLQPRKKLKQEVHIWFCNVERIKEEIRNVENELPSSNFFTDFGKKVLKDFGKKVLSKIDEVDELLLKGKSFDGLVIDDPKRIGQVLSTTTLFGEVQEKLMGEIWDYLMGGKVSKIGVWGMGGVGKTTIMKLIHNKLVKESTKFDKVIWITVSKEINISKLQNRIAREINESFEDDDETIRAGMLNELLLNMALEGKYVLILDDLWANISLEAIGIPEPSNGSKLVITTRSLDVCRNLDCEEVRIPTLLERDARRLFLEKVGKDVVNFPDLLPFVKSVVKECDGLPLAIVTIAGSMRKVRDIPSWTNVLHELKKQVKSVSGMNEKIFQKLKFSYDCLEKEMKLCFLCCALYPEDFEIKANELISLWIAEGYVQEMNSLQAEIDRGHAILNRLKNGCLIEDGYRKNTVKLHDLVRDMALHITSSRPQFLLRAGMQLLEIPEVKEEWNESLEKISLVRSLFLQIPSKMSPPNYPVLTTLLLSYCRIKSIPECFFEKMPRLRILDLSWNNVLTSLPNSISNLGSLTTLLLRECRGIKEMPSVSKLKNLKKLDLHSTGMEEVPHGIDELVKLRYLDLSGTNIRKIDIGILGGMVGIKLLAQLEFLGRMCFDELEKFNSYAQALEERVQRKGEWPHHYNITVGKVNYEEADEYILDEEAEHEKLIAFINCEIGTKNIKLPSNVENLEFRYIIIYRRQQEVIFSNLITANVSFSSLKKIYLRFRKINIKKLFSFHWASCNLQNLEDLNVGSNSRGVEDLQLEEIIVSESESDEKIIKLPRLRRLKFYALPALKNICSENVSLVCDSKVEIVIESCPKCKWPALIFQDDGSQSPKELV